MEKPSKLSYKMSPILNLADGFFVVCHLICSLVPLFPLHWWSDVEAWLDSGSFFRQDYDSCVLSIASVFIQVHDVCLFHFYQSQKLFNGVRGYWPGSCIIKFSSGHLERALLSGPEGLSIISLGQEGRNPKDPPDRTVSSSPYPWCPCPSLALKENLCLSCALTHLWMCVPSLVDFSEPILEEDTVPKSRKFLHWCWSK